MEKLQLLTKKWVAKGSPVSHEEWNKKCKDFFAFLMDNHLYKGYFADCDVNNPWFSFVVSKSDFPKVEEYIQKIGFKLLEKRPMEINIEGGQTLQ